MRLAHKYDVSVLVPACKTLLKTLRVTLELLPTVESPLSVLSAVVQMQSLSGFSNLHTQYVATMHKFITQKQQTLNRTKIEHPLFSQLNRTTLLHTISCFSPSMGTIFGDK
jgi:hypothetical protein